MNDTTHAFNPARHSGARPLRPANSARRMLGIAAVTLAGSLATAPLWAAPANEAALEARIAALETQLAALKDAVAARPAASIESTAIAPAPKAQADSKGASITSAAGDYSFALTGVVHSDGVYSLQDDTVKDGFQLSRVRPTISGKLGERLSFRITPELGGTNSSLLDAWADLQLGTNTVLRVGQMKSPVSLERLISATSLPFIRRAYGSDLAGNRDIGVQLQGAWANGTISYAAGLFNGTTDGRSAAASNPDDELELAGRLFFEPWRNGDGPLKGLGFGIAGSAGEKEGRGNDFLPRYRSPALEMIFNYRDTIAADGDHRRFSPQGYYYNGPFGLLAEYITSEQEVLNTTTGATDTFTNEAWQVTASWVLTGETAGYKGLTPNADFGWSAGGSPGAWEILARLSTLEIDDEAFPVFADPAVAIETADTLGLGVNWYLSRNLKASMNYQLTEFERGDANGDRIDEEVIFSRLQFAF